MTRPGDDEFSQAGRAGAVAAVGWLMAQLLGGQTAPLLVSATFLVWLVTLLALARCFLAFSVAVWKRQH